MRVLFLCRTALGFTSFSEGDGFNKLSVRNSTEFDLFSVKESTNLMYRTKSCNLQYVYYYIEYCYGDKKSPYCTVCILCPFAVYFARQRYIM